MSRPIKKIRSGILVAAMLLSVTGCASGDVQEKEPVYIIESEEMIGEENHHHELSEVEQTVEDPISGYCGNTVTKLQECNTCMVYEFYGSDSVTLTDILINMEYKQEEICKCPAQYYVDTEFATGYEINVDQGFVRCEKGQAMLTEEQLEIIREIIERIESGDYWKA